MGAATAERPGSTPFRCTPKLLSFRSFALLPRSIKPDRENATNVHDDVQSIFRPAPLRATPSLVPARAHVRRSSSRCASPRSLRHSLSLSLSLARACATPRLSATTDAGSGVSDDPRRRSAAQADVTSRRASASVIRNFRQRLALTRQLMSPSGNQGAAGWPRSVQIDRRGARGRDGSLAVC